MPPLIVYDDPDIPYDGLLPYDSPVPFQPQALELWITNPESTYIAHLDRSEESPFRNFAISLVRNEPGAGSFEYHPDNQILRDHPTIFDFGNIVWVRYRGRLRAWIIEDDHAVADQSEEEWRKVSGRGTLQLLGDRLVFPPDFGNGGNLDPSTWSEQFYSVVNIQTADLLTSLIGGSNVRFAQTITLGTITDNPLNDWTQDFKFDNMLEDVIADVVALGHGDVEMNGLEFSYWSYGMFDAGIGQGQDLQDSLMFEEGRDIERLDVKRTDRDRVSYVVAEGPGEGVFGQLRQSDRPTDIRRREGYLSAKDVSDLSMLQLHADAARDESVAGKQLAFDVNETRYKVFTDYDLGDRVRTLHPSLHVDEVSRIDAIYLAEDGDRVRVSLDVNGLRDDDILRLHGKAERTRKSLGVSQRQQQVYVTDDAVKGLAVVSSDGVTTIIDGTSNMFKISSTGTLEVNCAAWVSGPTQDDVDEVTLSGLGTLAVPPAHLSLVTADLAAGGDRVLGLSFTYAAPLTADNIIGLKSFATVHTYLNGSSQGVVRLRGRSLSTSTRDFYARYYILHEVAL